MHLVDIALFYSPENGAVKAYLSAKAKWLSSFARLQHSIVIPSTNDEVYNYGVLGVPSVSVPFTSNFFMPSSAKAIASMLSRQKPDCIEVGDPFHFAKAALEIKRKSRVPIVAFCHFDLACLVGQRFGWLAEKAMMRYLSSLYRQFDVVLTSSADLEQKLRENNVARARYQSLGVDTSVFNTFWRDHRLRSRLGLPPNSRLLAHASRFSSAKRLASLVRAVEKLGPSYHLMVIGNKGDALPSSKQASRISLPQNARALATLLASCDLMVHTDKSTGSGSLAKEAMACGLPIVGLRSRELEEMVDKSTGKLVDTGDHDEIAQGIQHVYRTGLPELSRNARRKMVQHFDWEHILPQLMAQHISLIAASGRKFKAFPAESVYVNHE